MVMIRYIANHKIVDTGFAPLTFMAYRGLQPQSV